MASGICILYIFSGVHEISIEVYRNGISIQTFSQAQMTKHTVDEEVSERLIVRYETTMYAMPPLTVASSNSMNIVRIYIYCLLFI